MCQYYYQSECIAFLEKDAEEAAKQPKPPPPAASAVDGEAGGEAANPASEPSPARAAGPTFKLSRQASLKHEAIARTLSINSVA